MRLVVHGTQGCTETTIAAGERVLDALDDAGHVPLSLFSCRSANCGICLAHVRRGAAQLEAATPGEMDTLRHLGAPEGARLLCQVRVADSAAGAAAIAEFELLQAASAASQKS